MKVIHIVISLEPGGLEKLVVDMTNRRNDKIPGSSSICCLDSAGQMAGALKGGKVTVLNSDRGKWPYDFKAVRGIGKLINGSAEPVILHAHNLAAWQYAVLAKRGTTAKLVYTQHGANIHNYGLANRIRCKILSKFTDRIVAVSKTTAQSASEAYSIPSERIDIIYNGVDTVNLPQDIQRIKKQQSEKLGLDPDCFVVGSVGRFSAEKNYSLLVRAFTEFSSEVRNSRLILVGDGPDAENIKKAIRDSAIESRCILPGMQKDIWPWYSVMDLFCLSSVSEGVPVSMLEAGGIGLPVILTDVGGCSEVIKDGKHGLIVPPSDKESLVKAMKLLHSDAGLRNRMSAEIKKHIKDDFSLDKMMQAYEDIYKHVL